LSPAAAVGFIVRVTLGLYAPIIGFTLVVLIAAAFGWAAWRQRNSIRQNRGYSLRGLPHELREILTEFEQSIDASLAEAQKSAKIGEAVMAAAKAIELALRDFEKRVTELQKRSDAAEKQLAELKSSLGEEQKSSEGKANAIERISGRLDGGDQRLTTLTDQLSGLKQMVESGISQQKETGEELRAVKSGIAQIQTQVNGLAQRMAVAEKSQVRLLAVTESMNKSMVASLKAISEETVQRVSALEQRILWRIDGLETRVNSTAAALDRPPADHVEEMPKWR
jgi:chromosome segregation ATPase